MSFSNTKDNIDQMRIQLQGITSLFESSYLKISSELSLLDMRMTQLEVAADPNAGSESDEDFLKFSKKSLDKLIKTIEETPLLPGQELFTKFRVVVDQRPDDSNDVYIVATDGSVREGNQRKAAAFSVAFAQNSRFNLAKLALKASNSTQAEVLGILQALISSKELGLKRLAILVDNQAAISFASTAIQFTLANSTKLQEIEKINPLYKMTAAEINKEASFFDYIALIWVKSHVGRQDLFTALNDQADRLCQEKSALLLESLTAQ